MTYVIPEVPVETNAVNKIQVHAAVSIAKILHKHSPERIRRVLTSISRGARSATYEEARQVRDEVLTLSPLCRGGSACLIRSLATVLVCRARGIWPTWCVGVITAPPFAAHAWLEAEGQIVDEPLSSQDFRAFFKVAV